jgi:hypothetical protein
MHTPVTEHYRRYAYPKMQERHRARFRACYFEELSICLLS